MRLDQLGISEYDAYGIMWHGNHIKWMKRAVVHGRPTNLALLHIRYYVPLSWGGATPHVQVVVMDATTVLVLLCVEELCCTAAIMERSGDYPERWERLDELPADRGRQLTRQRKQLENLSSARVLDGLTVPAPAFDTIFRSFGRLDERTMLDMCDQSRTRLVGGLAAVQELNERGEAFLVAQIDHLTIAARETAGAEIVCRTSVTHQNWTVFFCRHALSVVGGNVVGTMDCKFVLFNRSESVPARASAAIQRGMETVLQWSTILNSLG